MANYSGNGASYLEIAAYIGIILAIIATVLAFVFIVPEKFGNSDNKFVKFLHNLVNFKSLLIEKILQSLYIFSTAFCILYGALMIFSFENSYYYLYTTGHISWTGWKGLLLIILGPLAVRLIYEGLMLMVLLVKNVIDIRNKFYNNTGTDFKTEVSFDTPQSKATTPSWFGTVPTNSTPESPKPVQSQTPVAKPSVNEWQCPKCGKIHQNYVGTCGCGEQKPSN